MSYRIKIPLGLTLVLLLSGLVLSAVLILQAQNDQQKELLASSTNTGAILANSLIEAMRHDDVWRAYQALAAASSGAAIADHRLLLVIDNSAKIYVSNSPRLYAMQQMLGNLHPELAQLTANHSAPRSQTSLHEIDDSIYVLHPLIDDGIKVGHLVMGYSKSEFMPALYAIYWRVTLTSFGVIAILIPIGWQMGNSMVNPLVNLTRSMGLIGQRPFHEIEFRQSPRNDEIGQLESQFGMLLNELADKEQLEHQMVASERLAAIGTLAAGVAHEINNPLGGMLNAINTFKRFGHADPVAQKTATLLERGLEQIQDIVGALLVQARAESHRFAVTDVSDVEALLKNDAEKSNVTLRFDVTEAKDIYIPSTPIRQVLINLCLNAIQASDSGSNINCQVTMADGLTLVVSNPGEDINVNGMGNLFEPFTSRNEAGHGLGLWVTYQIVQQLQGEITVVSEDGITQFSVHIPAMALQSGSTERESMFG